MIRTLYVAERARLIRFGVSGLGSTALHALIAAAMFALLDATPVTANAVAFACSTAFRQTGSSSRKAASCRATT